MSIENSSDNIRYMLNTVKSYVGEVIAFLTISSILLTIDPVALVVVLLVTIICLPLNKYASKLLYEYREKRTELHRKGDYFARVFYLPEYAGEIKISKISTLLTDRFNKQADVIVENEGSIIIQGKYILDIVRKLPDKYINIEVWKEE